MTVLKYRLMTEFVKKSETKKIISVSDLTQNIRNFLEKNFSDIWVEGEISNFKFHTSGHMYFSLKDENAQIACVMFRRENVSLGFEPKDGLQAICFGRVSVYPVRGQYQLVIERLEPKGVGALELRFQELKEKLRREGLFEEARKKEIPFLPNKIALVTSIDGAALRDILNVLDRRYANTHLLIYPVPVQGAGAGSMIAEAIADLNRHDIADVMIVARGGGSLEDLWAFNEEVVARAIFQSRIPVISAVGHETDFTIADFVADLRAPTPSAAAELVMPLREDLLARVTELIDRSFHATDDFLNDLREQWKRLAESRTFRDPLSAFEASSQRLDELVKNLRMIFQHLIAAKRDQAGILIGKLGALGPLATLQRGFSVTIKYPDRRIVNSVRRVKRGDVVQTRVQDGFFVSRVTEVENGG
jgi:exodeoxyribonuclease VII large subunit